MSLRTLGFYDLIHGNCNEGGSVIDAAV